MKPREQVSSGMEDMFRHRLENLLDRRHPLIDLPLKTFAEERRATPGDVLNRGHSEPAAFRVRELDGRGDLDVQLPALIAHAVCCFAVCAGLPAKACAFGLISLLLRRRQRRCPAGCKTLDVASADLSAPHRSRAE